VKEQSHKSEMRDALRGDFERLRARREDGGATIVAAPPADEIVPAPEVVQPVEAAVEPDVQPIAEPVEEPVAAVAPPARSSWLARLRDRR
jgi:hypothetical protein